MREELAIGEVARRTGVSPSALRFYEETGVLPPPRRVNGRRRYDPGVVRTVAVIRSAQAAGFSLTEIRALLDGGGDGPGAPLGERWKTLARTKLREIDAMVARAARMRGVIEAGLACRCGGIEDCALAGPER